MKVIMIKRKIKSHLLLYNTSILALIIYGFLPMYIKAMEQSEINLPIEFSISIDWNNQIARRLTVHKHDDIATALCIFPKDYNSPPILGEISSNRSPSQCSSKLIIALLTFLAEKRFAQLTMLQRTYEALLKSCSPNTLLFKLINEIRKEENPDKIITLFFSKSDDSYSDSDDDSNSQGDQPDELTVQEYLETPKIFV